MKKSRSINLNLASHPWRNKRLFYLVLSIVVVSLLVVSFFAGKIFIRYKSDAQRAKSSIRQTDKLIRDTQRNEKSLSSRINEAVKSNKSQVDMVNSIILKKSFSWIEFFADLEKSLPDSSYIVSLAPTLTEDSEIILRLRVACISVDDLLKLIDNFGAMKFDEIQIEGETLSERGLLISEISLRYERII
jgi:hypothetical protein